MKTFKGYGNFWKIYGMSDFQLWLLELGMLLIVITRPIRAVHAKIIHLPKLIITPSGILLDRRHSRRFVIHERRFSEILRYKLYLFLHDFNDGEGTS